MQVSLDRDAQASNVRSARGAPSLAVVERALRLQTLDAGDDGSAEDRRVRLRSVLMQAEGLRASVHGVAARQRLANLVDEAQASARGAVVEAKGRSAEPGPVYDAGGIASTEPPTGTAVDLYA